MTTERFSLDTSILVYAADVAAGERHQRALEILDRAVRRGCVLTLQALAEFFHAATRKRMVARTEAAAQLRDWATAFPTVSADPGALWMALEFAADGAAESVGCAPSDHGCATRL
jgi:predicted nucleic acid-binding protein